jgi:hypothetical protein
MSVFGDYQTLNFSTPLILTCKVQPLRVRHATTLRDIKIHGMHTPLTLALLHTDVESNVISKLNKRSFTHPAPHTSVRRAINNHGCFMECVLFSPCKITGRGLGVRAKSHSSSSQCISPTMPAVTAITTVIKNPLLFHTALVSVSL